MIAREPDVKVPNGPSQTDKDISNEIYTWIIGIYALGLGISIIAGGKERWRGPAYTTALQVPGAPASWGIMLTIFSGLALIGMCIRTSPTKFHGELHAKIYSWVAPFKYWVISFFFNACGIWFALFSITFYIEYLNKNASFAAMWQSGLMVILCIVTGNQYSKKTRGS